METNMSEPPQNLQKNHESIQRLFTKNFFNYSIIQFNNNKNMANLDWTSIVLALITLVSGCGWLIDHKKHHQEVESLKADTNRKYLDLVTEFVTKFRELIVQPLERHVNELKTEVNHLKDATEFINDCPVGDNCPVRKHLHHQTKSEVESRNDKYRGSE